MGETYFIKKKKESNYTQLDNTCVKDERLNWKEKGVHTYLMTLPSDWKIYMSEIVKHSRDGKAALYSAVQGLENFGYLKRIRNRDKNGRFENLVYIVYEEPSQADNDEPLSENPEMEKSNTEECNSDNQPVLTTDYLPNTNDIQKTEPTNSSSSPEDNTEKSVSESVFLTKIKELFSGEYPFDNNFENAVKKNLSEHKISDKCTVDYLNYVFFRTKLRKPAKSFEGFYRSLALAPSIARDFINGSASQNINDASVTSKIIYVDCPICGKKFDIKMNNCPECNASVDDIEKNNERNLNLTKRLYQMSPEQKEAMDKERERRSKSSPLKILNSEEWDQLYKDFGLLD